MTSRDPRGHSTEGQHTPGTSEAGRPATPRTQCGLRQWQCTDGTAAGRRGGRRAGCAASSSDRAPSARCDLHAASRALPGTTTLATGPLIAITHTKGPPLASKGVLLMPERGSSSSAPLHPAADSVACTAHRQQGQAATAPVSPSSVPCSRSLRASAAAARALTSCRALDHGPSVHACTAQHRSQPSSVKAPQANRAWTDQNETRGAVPCLCRSATNCVIGPNCY
jgi:hypothetical protein